MLVAGPVVADSLTGANRILCSTQQVDVCFDGGDCARVLPEDLNIPQFIEVNLKAKKLSTTAASGEIADDDAGKGAAYGAGIGVLAGRRRGRMAEEQAAQQVQAQAQEQRQANQKQIENFKKAFSVCLEVKNYMVKF